MAEMRPELGGDMPIRDMLMLMAEGNIGALTTLMKLIETDTGLFMILHLDDMNIRGTQVWIAYKEFAGQDMAKFVEAIKNRDAEMVATVNRVGAEGNHRWRAVSHGASSSPRLLLD